MPCVAQLTYAAGYCVLEQQRDVINRVSLFGDTMCSCRYAAAVAGRYAAERCSRGPLRGLCRVAQALCRVARATRVLLPGSYR